MSEQREQQDNRGAIFKNTRKELATHADYQGSATIAGVSYWMNAWIKEGQTGKYLSVAFRPKEVRQARQAPPRRDDMDDQIPFL